MIERPGGPLDVVRLDLQTDPCYLVLDLDDIATGPLGALFLEMVTGTDITNLSWGPTGRTPSAST